MTRHVDAIGATRVTVATGSPEVVAGSDIAAVLIDPGATGTLQVSVSLSSVAAVSGNSGGFTVTNATNTLNDADHTLVDGDRVEVSTDGALPTGLSAATPYWVVSAASGTFQLSATPGGSAVALTNNGTGNHTWTQTAIWVDLEAAQSAAKIYELAYDVTAIRITAATANGQAIISRGAV